MSAMTPLFMTSDSRRESEWRDLRQVSDVSYLLLKRRGSMYLIEAYLVGGYLGERLGWLFPRGYHELELTR